MTHVPDSVHMHGHWNSVITATLLRHAAHLKLLPFGETSPAKLPAHCLDPIGRLMKELLAAACAHQATHPKAIGAIERIINRRLWNALKVFSHVELGKYQQLEFDPYPDPPVTPPIATTTRGGHPVQASAQPSTRRYRS